MPIRILHIVSYMQRGGLETLLMNCFRHIDRKKVQFDFIVHRSFRSDYDDEIETLGGRIYRMPRLNPFSAKYKKALLDFFVSHPEYKIVHCHLDCMSAVPLSVAQKCGVPVRIAHSHNSNQLRDWKYPLKRFFMKRIPDTATHFFACSNEAGCWMFPGQDFTLIKNGIESEKYSFSKEKRTAIRDELGLNDSFVLGHVGRFSPQKNHEFLIDIFESVCKKRTDAKLLLVGKGALEEDVRNKVQKLNLEDKVIFLGVRDDVHDILQAMDVFVLPSLYEGLGMVVVEALTAGVKCIVSNKVPSACNLTGDVIFKSLKDSADEWTDTILSLDLGDRVSGRNVVVHSGYDIQNTSDYLQKWYIEKW